MRKYPVTNRQIAARMRKHGWKKNFMQMSRAGVTWAHPMHKEQLLTISKYAPSLIATGKPLTVCIPATLSEDRMDSLHDDGLDLYNLDEKYPFADVLTRLLDWFDRIAVTPAVDA
ncbi:MAG: hypothetical protein JSV81_05715 [Anaerolineales bacterium]|nr:MAG: hypothetical protein JSV81_05715 [Anaerolineales bacterium]